MAIALVIGALVVIMLVGRAGARLHRDRSRRSREQRVSEVRLGGGDRHGADEERALTGRLLTGHLSRDGYRDAMARLAAGDDSDDDDVAMLLWRARLGPAGDDGPRDLLDRLAATLHGVLPGVVCTAAVLASTGADADELMRTLSLTRVQARTIIDAVTTS